MEKKLQLINGDWNIENVSSCTVLECLNEHGNAGERTGTGFAPHVVNIARCGFMAVNKVCIVNSHILHERVPQNVYSHEIQVDAENFGRISLPIIDDFLERMELKNTYKISIYNALDYNGRIAPFSILAAIWKSLSIFEKRETTYFGDDSIWEDKVFYKYLLDSKVDIEGKMPLASSIINGSMTHVYLPPLDENDNQIRSVKSTAFYENFDVMFVRTNLHKSDFEPAELLEGSRRNGQVERFRKCMAEENSDFYDDTAGVPFLIMSTSETRFGVENSNPSDEFEQDCHAGVQVARDQYKEELRGFEVQQGGIMIVLKKNEFFNNEDLLKVISNSIAEQSKGGKITQISFNLLQPSRGAYGREHDPKTAKFISPICRQKAKKIPSSGGEPNRTGKYAKMMKTKAPVFRRQPTNRVATLRHDLGNDESEGDLSNDDTISEVSHGDFLDRTLDDF